MTEFAIKGCLEILPEAPINLSNKLTLGRFINDPNNQDAKNAVMHPHKTDELKDIADIIEAEPDTLINMFNDSHGMGRDYVLNRISSCYPALDRQNEAFKADLLKLLAERSSIRTDKPITQKTSKKKGKKAAKAVKNGSEEKIIIQTSLIEDNGIMYEEIYRDKAVSFIDSAGNEYKSIDVDGITYEPIMGDELKLNAVKLPSGIEDYDTDETLIKEIKSHIHKYTDVSPFFETISAYYIFLTWLYDELNTLPYLRVLGDTGCGKSRYEDTVGRLCYKASFVSGALTPAPIYRLIGKWGGTIIIDEGDFKNSNEKNEVIKILNCGYERDRSVCRCQTDNPDNLLFLPTFSPKLISSRKRFDDVALESRCLTEVMLETSRADIPYLLPQEFYEEEMPLRNKLLNYRFRNHGSVDIAKAQGMTALKVENRLKQTMSPFMVLFADNTEVHNGFVRFIESYNRELVEVRAETIEGAIVDGMYNIIKEKTLGGGHHADVLNVPNVQFSDEDLKSVYITSNDIAEYLQENQGLRDVTFRGVGRRLKTLGITSILKGKGAKRGRYLDLNERTIVKLKRKYIPCADRQLNVIDIKDVHMVPSPHNIKNVCDRCGKDAVTTECNGMWLCDTCITDNAGQWAGIDSIKAKANDEEFQDIQNREAKERMEAERRQAECSTVRDVWHKKE
jgi:ribosomal protein L37AE/L43A